MNKKSSGSLKSKVSWTLIGNLIFQASQWLMLSILSKVADPIMVGQYSLALAITTPIMVFMNLQLRTILATDAKSLYGYGDYFTIRFFSNIVFMLVVTIILMLGNYNQLTIIVTIIIAIAKITESFTDLIYGYNQKHENMKNIAVSQILRGALSLILFTLLIIITGKLELAVLGICVAWLVVLITYDTKKLSSYSLKFLTINKTLNFKLIKIAIPLGIVLLLSSLNTNIPRMFIERFIGLTELGYFAAIAYLIVAGNTVIVSIGQAAAPRLAKYVANLQFGAFKKLLTKLILIGFSIGLVGSIGALIAGEWFLKTVYTESYARYNNLFLLLMIVGGLDYISSFFGYGLTALRNYRIQPKIAIFWTLSCVVTSLFFIPAYGLIGAGYALLLSSFIRLILQSLAFKYSYRLLQRTGGDSFEKNTSRIVVK